MTPYQAETDDQGYARVSRHGGVAFQYDVLDQGVFEVHQLIQSGGTGSHQSTGSLLKFSPSFPTFGLGGPGIKV